MIHDYREHSIWLQVETVFDHLNTDADIVLPPKSSTSGCPCLSYEEKSFGSKRGNAAHLSKKTQQHDPKLIVHAASISARQKGDNDIAAVLKEVNRSPSSPSNAVIPLRLDGNNNLILWNNQAP